MIYIYISLRQLYIDIIYRILIDYFLIKP